MNEPHLASAEFGGFRIRFLAVLVDSAIVFLGTALIIAGGALALGPEMAPLAGLASWLFAFLYWPVLQASPLQATFGKALLRLRVTGYQGNRISFLRALGRELAKILSSAVLMVGYILAGFTARKQALHDLVASTYVVREGKARVVPALAVMVASFGLPVVLLPMLLGSAMVDSMMASVTAMSALEPAPPAAPPPMKPKPPVGAAAPKPPAVTEPPKPAPVVVEAPKPPPPIETKQAEAPKPAPAIETKRVETPKPAPKPRPVATAAAPQPRAPAAVQPKAAPALKYNDLMTAVLYKDAEAVAELLRHGTWVDKPDSRGATPLMLAVELGDARTAETLLRGGANPSRAVRVAQSRRDAAMLDLLTRYGAR
jgi:uncharacterized RDD family membrane protein YckC